MHLASSPASELYWEEFDVTDEDLEFIDDLLLEREVPLTKEEMSRALVAHRLDLLRVEQESRSNIELNTYAPAGEYDVGESLVFRLLDNRIGTVASIREANNPDLPPFDVIQVKFEGSDEPKEFAARFQEHVLNSPGSEAGEIESDV